MKLTKGFTVLITLMLPLVPILAGSSGCVTTVLVVRHAERANSSSTSPISDPEGRNRAKALAHVAREAGVSAIYATEYLRTQQTAQPLADQLGLPIDTSFTDPSALAEGILREHRGDTVLVVGHSNTVGPIIEALGGDPIDPIGASEFDNLFLVIRHRRGTTHTVHLKYLRYDESPAGD